MQQFCNLHIASVCSRKLFHRKFKCFFPGERWT